MIKEPPIWQGKGARHFRQRERERKEGSNSKAKNSRTGL